MKIRLIENATLVFLGASVMMSGVTINGNEHRKKASVCQQSEAPLNGCFLIFSC